MRPCAMLAASVCSRNSGVLNSPSALAFWRLEATKAEAQAKARQKIAEAESLGEIARAEAQFKVKLKGAEAEAEGIRKIAAARGEEAKLAQESPSAYLQIKTLEAELQRWKQWDGKYPAYWLNMGGTNAPSVLMPLPTLPAPDSTKTVRVDEKK